MNAKKMDATEAIKLISTAVDASWDSGEDPVLLSQIGNLEKGNVIVFIKSLGKPLKDFVIEHMNDKYRVESHSENKAVIGIFPINQDTKSISNFDKFFDYTTNKSKKRVRIQPVFWAAFKKALGSEENRFIIFEPKQTFISIPKTQNAPDGGIPLSPQFIASEAASDVAVYENISKWLEEQSLSIEKISQGRHSHKDQPKLPSNATILDHLFASLTTDELKRISIPLDVLKKMYSSKL